MLSIIVPCYNEEKRIRPFLEKLVKTCQGPEYEIIIVDDGSNDKTIDVVRSITNGKKNCRIISYKPNKGKGWAVKTGVLASKGQSVLFIDADGSIDPKEIKKMKKYLEKFDVVVGTRSSKHSKVMKQPKKRKIFGVMFNVMVNILFQTGISDSLCGFKGFRKDAAKDIFGTMKSNRWVFDVEILYRVKKEKYTLYRLPIKWEHKDKSKIGPTEPINIFFDLLALRFRI